MRPSLLYRISRASVPLRRLSGLTEQLRSRLRWGWLIFGLAIILAVPMAVMTLTGYATSSSSICLSCHGTAEAAYVPESKIVTEEKQCIEPTQYMRDKHTDLLNDWKESVVRQGARTYVASDGQEYNMSLTSTCMECHSNKAEFCDQCHNYVAIKPTCWDCHNLPEGG